MRIAIVNLTGGGLSGGYRKYLKNILPRFDIHEDVDAILCLSPEGIDVSSWFDGLKKVDFDYCEPLNVASAASFSNRKISRRLRNYSPDIVFVPMERRIRCDGVPVVNMVRNMEPFMPALKDDTPRQHFRKLVQRRLALNSIKHVTHTFAVSNFVKDQLTNKMQIPEYRISRVYHGITPPMFGNSIRPASIPRGWDDNFLFTCGSVRPARGLTDILEAIGHLKPQFPDLRLVIAGETIPEMRRYKNNLEDFIGSRGLEDNVCWAGKLNSEGINWCYEECSFFIVTSRIEACPNIVLEAMSYGCVSVSTDSMPMPEFFRDTAVYYSNGDGKSLSSAIRNVLKFNDKKKNELSNMAKMRATDFSWDICADKTLGELKRIIFSYKQRQKERM